MGRMTSPYMKWKITAMFETTNQIVIHQPENHHQSKKIWKNNPFMAETTNQISWFINHIKYRYTYHKP